jgi:transcription elongation factor Elf1
MFKKIPAGPCPKCHKGTLTLKAKQSSNNIKKRDTILEATCSNCGKGNTMRINFRKVGLKT